MITAIIIHFLLVLISYASSPTNEVLIFKRIFPVVFITPLLIHTQAKNIRIASPAHAANETSTAYRLIMTDQMTMYNDNELGC